MLREEKNEELKKFKRTKDKQVNSCWRVEKWCLGSSQIKRITGDGSASNPRFIKNIYIYQLQCQGAAKQFTRNEMNIYKVNLKAATACGLYETKTIFVIPHTCT